MSVHPRRCVSYDITRVTRTTTSVYTHFFANNGTTYVPLLDSLFGKHGAYRVRFPTHQEPIYMYFLYYQPFFSSVFVSTFL